MVIVWAATGPVFHYSETWQLVINTGTTIITFLMVFLIQKSQNKESMALQLKLNEIVAASHHASNRLVDVEDMSADELKVLRKYYSTLKIMAERDNSLQKSHSVEEAEKQHNLKNELRRKRANTMGKKSEKSKYVVSEGNQRRETKNHKY